LIMFVWSFFGITTALLFLSSIYFTHVYITKKDVSIWTKSVWLLLLLPLILFIKYSAPEFDLAYCEVSENIYYATYIYLIGLISFIWIISLAVFSFFKTKEVSERKQITYLTIGISAFLVFFSISGFFASYIGNFELEQYGLFGMVIFMAYLAFLIVRFKAFDIKLIGAQALVWALVILVGSQFLFIQTNINRVLTAITLFLSAIMGMIIVRGVKKEISLREQLEVANNNQASLIHFISHQLKGFFTKSKMIFAGIIEGDFGQVSQEVLDMAQIGLDSDNNAVSMVQDILKASNLKTGITDYIYQKLDLAGIVRKVAESFVDEMQGKGLEYNIDIPDKVVPSMIDETQITQVFKNLIDNSFRYTLSGQVSVSVKVDTMAKKILFVISDTGIGLSPEDKKKLFTEGGKGEESIKMNTNSTGYGLYIVKKIVESHHGRIWAESAGRGHGSKFSVELNLVE
jgi:signal transduction histidine kinase